jgi:hypothetical protein
MGAHGADLGLHGAGRKITAKGDTARGAYGYGQGDHGQAVHLKHPAAKCGQPGTHIHSLVGGYHVANLDDYQTLCLQCHDRVQFSEATPRRGHAALRDRGERI